MYHKQLLNKLNFTLIVSMQHMYCHNENNPAIFHEFSTIFRSYLQSSWAILTALSSTTGGRSYPEFLGILHAFSVSLEELP